MKYHPYAEVAMAHLSRHDPHLAPIIEQFGPCPVVPHTDFYRDLVESIIGQQLSVKAAASIKGRFIELFGHFPTPTEILQTDIETLRSVGFSRPKAGYVQDLARHILDGSLEIEKLPALTNEQIIAELTAIKGVGEWTAHMFLLFCLGRPDVLAVGDLGIRNGIKKLYKLSEPPDTQMVRDIAKTYHWHPYESLACWYIWKSLDNAPSGTAPRA